MRVDGWQGFVIGAGVGFFAGYVFAVARRALKDYNTVKGSVPTFRKSWWIAAAIAGAWLGLVWFTGAALTK